MSILASLRTTQKDLLIIQSKESLTPRKWDSSEASAMEAGDLFSRELRYKAFPFSSSSLSLFSASSLEGAPDGHGWGLGSPWITGWGQRHRITEPHVAPETHSWARAQRQPIISSVQPALWKGKKVFEMNWGWLSLAWWCAERCRGFH